MELTQEVARRTRQIVRAVPPGDTPTPSSSLAEAILALARLQVAKAEDHLLAIRPSAVTDAEQCLGRARELLRIKNPGSPSTLVRHGRFLEHAYFARNDGTAQPYFVYVPSSYAGRARVPLVLFLHGWDPAMGRTNPWLVPDFVLDLAEQHGVLFAIPHGRTNTDFQFAGEVDVLRVEEEIRKFYRVDPERIYLLGVSMGGAGVWQIGAHYPDHFAAIAPINGQGDWFRFWQEQFRYPPRHSLPSHVQRLIAMNNPTDLARNLSQLYSYGQHATRCFLGPQHTREMMQRLRQFGASCDFFEDPSPLGHYTYLEKDCWARAFRHLLRHTRLRNPEEIRYTTHSLRFPGSYWIEVRGIMRWGSPARVHARRTPEGTLRVETENAAALRFSPPHSWAGKDGMFTIQWNDAEPARYSPDADGRVLLSAPGFSAPHGPRTAKSRSVCGPVADVFNFPFVAVRGTTGTPQQVEASHALARQFARDWAAYAEGQVFLTTDTAVTDASMKDKGLVLFGLPEVNSVTARLAPKLPFRLSHDRIVLPDGRTFQSREVGLLLTYPNPLAPDRYILIYHGIPWGKGRSENHKFDLLPDFAVYTREALQPIGINRYLAAGFFDEFWRYSPALTDFAPATRPPRARPSNARGKE